MYKKMKQALFWFGIGMLACLLVACGTPATVEPTPEVSEIQAIPEKIVLVGESITLNVNANGAITGYRWEASLDDLSGETQSTITYQAPDQPGEDLVKVYVIFGSGAEVQRSLVIQVVAPTATPTPPPTPTSTPTPTTTPEPTNTPTIEPTATPGPLMVASFTTCDKWNDLEGEMGGSFSDPKVIELENDYYEVNDRGCVVNISYNLNAWGGFFLKLEGIDLSTYRSLAFDIRSLSGNGIPAEIKIELSRPGQCSVARVEGVEAAWTTMVVPLVDFKKDACKYDRTISTWDQMEELVFVVERAKAGTSGEFELDNIQFLP